VDVELPLDISPQPDDTTCGPTCLHAVYAYYGETLTLEQIIQETPALDAGGTLAVSLACHALRRGYVSTIYSYNLQMFDPSWFAVPDTDFSGKLKAQIAAKEDPKLRYATEGYLEFLQLGGKLRSIDLTPNLIRGILRRKLPILTGLSSTYLYQSKRVFGPKDDSDDIRGNPCGHFVVLAGLMGAALLLTLSRAGTVSVVLALVFMFTLLAVSRRKLLGSATWIFSVVLVVVLLLLANFGVEPILERFKTVQTLSTEPHAIPRVLIWRGTLEIIAQNFLWGSGPGTFEDVFLMFRPLGFWFRPVYVHNDYLNLLSDCGFFAFLAVIGIFVMLFYRGWRILRSDESRSRTGLAAGAMASLFATTLHNTIDFNFHIPANLVLTSVIAGLLLSIDRPRMYSSQLVARFTELLRPGLAVGVLVACAFFGLSDYFYWKGENAFQASSYETAWSKLNLSIFNNFIRVIN